MGTQNNLYCWQQIPHWNAAATQRIHSPIFKSESSEAEFDLTEQIYQTIQESKTNATFKHIKGHQDDHTEYHQLLFEAQLRDSFYDQD